jgi:hypothetical protein
VFILKGLTALVCTKIVQVSQGAANKRLRVLVWKLDRQECLSYLESKSAGKMPAVRYKGAIIYRDYYTPEVTVRQGKKVTEKSDGKK